MTTKSTITIAALLASLPMLSQANGTLVSESQQSLSHLAQTLNRQLVLTPDQQNHIDPIADRRQGSIDAIAKDSTLTDRQKQEKYRNELVALRAEILPYLTAEQAGAYDITFNLSAPKPKLHFPGVGLQGQLFFPSGGTARSIFGSSAASFGLGIGSAVADLGPRTRLEFTVSTFSVNNDGNDLFVISPQEIIEYRAPISKGLYAFTSFALGPSYMDYSFDTPSGAHYGAKRLGADADLEAGLRYGQFRFGVLYREFTEPAGINFSGFQLSLTWIPVKF
jgi:hypothetical protein